MTSVLFQPSFQDLLRIGSARAKFILIAAAIGCLLGYLASWSLSRVYRSEVMILPITTDDSQRGLSVGGQLGNLAALAGIGLGSGDQKNESFEFLQSRALAREFIVEQDLMPVFYPSRWNATAHKWKKHWWKSEPSLNDAVGMFRRSILHVHEDKRTGVLRLSIEWDDRQLAASWANGFVELANSQLRARTIEQSQSNLEYLNQEIKGTEVMEVRSALFRLVEEQTKRIMLAKTRKDYSFRVIDPAVVPDLEDSVRPNRTAVALMAGILVGVISLLGAAIRERNVNG
jgi:uncharacterized protein involved in exopolysaccharide biosynthesis